MRNINIFIHIFFLSILLTCPVLAGEEIPEPDEFNIYDVSSGDFLETDAGAYYYGAKQAFAEGDYELSAKYYLTYLQYDPTDNGAIYNLACCYGLLGEAELAAHYLRTAVRSRFYKLELIQTDPDFDLVRGDDVFKVAFAEVTGQLESMLPDTEVLLLPHEAYTTCHVRTPDDYIPGESRTLVVGLAANGGFAYGFSGIYDSFDDPDFVWASIQGPYPDIYGSYIMFNWDNWGAAPDGLPSDVIAMSTDYVINAIQSLAEELNADRVFLLGFNDGAAFAYRAGLASPDLVDGIISFEGHLDTGFIADSTFMEGTDVRVFIVHNLTREDDASEVLNGYGYDVYLYEYEGEPCEETAVYGEIQRWMKE